LLLFALEVPKFLPTTVTPRLPLLATTPEPVVPYASDTRHVGVWALSTVDEGLLFVIARAAGAYQVSVLFNYSVEPEEVRAARLEGNDLIATDGIRFTYVADSQLNTNYNLQGTGYHPLYRLTLSNYFGVWKAASASKAFVKIFKRPSPFASCGEGSESYALFLTKFRPDDGVYYNWQDLCGTENLMSNDSVSVRYIAKGKITLDWQSERIASETYNRVAPAFLLRD
jgi:hypothetical protein